MSEYPAIHAEMPAAATTSAATWFATSVATWAAFLLMCLGMFMAILDIQVVATSLPTIQGALGISQDAMSWIQTAYLIAEVIAIPLTGLLTRVLTLRWLFAAAVSLFTIASIGCALSGSFVVLLLFRIIQGFSGGVLIPAVFSAVFLLFPPRLHAVATTVGGVVAVLAPTIGPIVGGFITETWSWPWLFLINVIPGLIAVSITPLLLPRHDTDLAEFAKLDMQALVLMAVALACLEIGLKQAPKGGWLSPLSTGLLLVSATGIGISIWRTLGATHPVVRLSALRRRSFAVGCALSFCLGVGLFGSVYLMPVFLAFVRGVAIMFCLLPPTRFALGSLPQSEVSDASGLFNLMRNLGGAIGIALIDTILYGRTVGHGLALRDRLIAGDVTAAQAIGLDVQLFLHPPPDVSSATVEAYVRPMVERAAFAMSVYEAWALLALVALIALLLVPLAGKLPASELSSRL